MRVSRVFLDSDLRCSFEGLRLQAKAAKAPVDEQSTVLFINRARTAFKILHRDKYVVCYSNGTKRIPLEALIHLPEDFGGSEMEMNQAIRKSIEMKLAYIRESAL